LEKEQIIQMNIITKKIVERFPKEVLEFDEAAKRIINHKMFKRLNTIDNIAIYAEFQIWCVWDFMSILKRVQNLIFSNDIIWIPPRNPELGYDFYRLISTEETDIAPKESTNKRASHFHSFIAAMNQMGADTTRINNFLNELRKGNSLKDSLEKVKANEKIIEFLMLNNKLIISNPLNSVSLLTLTRENFLPAVFKSIMNNIEEASNISLFIWYHKRHILLDEGIHGPISDLIYNEFIVDDNQIHDSLIASTNSLNARNELLNEISRHLKP